MAMVTYLYEIQYIKSNCVCFTYDRLLWAMILHSNNLSNSNWHGTITKP